MSKKTTELKAELDRLLPAMEKIINVLNIRDLDVDKNDEDDRFLAEQLYKQGERLKEIVWAQEYLNGSVEPEGVLHHNSDGRYALDNGDYWTSGSSIEIKVWDEDEDRWEWIKTRIEHSSEKGDYYAVAMPKLKLEGVTARKRTGDIHWSRDW